MTKKKTSERGQSYLSTCICWKTSSKLGCSFSRSLSVVLQRYSVPSAGRKQLPQSASFTHQCTTAAMPGPLGTIWGSECRLKTFWHCGELKPRYERTTFRLFLLTGWATFVPLRFNIGERQTTIHPLRDHGGQLPLDKNKVIKHEVESWTRFLGFCHYTDIGLMQNSNWKLEGAKVRLVFLDILHIFALTTAPTNGQRK